MRRRHASVETATENRGNVAVPPDGESTPEQSRDRTRTRRVLGAIQRPARVDFDGPVVEELGAGERDVRVCTRDSDILVDLPDAFDLDPPPGRYRRPVSPADLDRPLAFEQAVTGEDDDERWQHRPSGVLEATIDVASFVRNGLVAVGA